MDYLMGTLRSHDQEHHECTEHFLCWQHSKEIGLDILNVFMMYQVGLCQAHFPFPYNVFTMSRAGKLGFVPSVRLCRNDAGSCAEDFPTFGPSEC
jgi:hypothetical protein